MKMITCLHHGAGAWPCRLPSWADGTPALGANAGAPVHDDGLGLDGATPVAGRVPGGRSGAALVAVVDGLPSGTRQAGGPCRAATGPAATGGGRESINQAVTVAVVSVT